MPNSKDMDYKNYTIFFIDTPNIQLLFEFGETWTNLK